MNGPVISLSAETQRERERERQTDRQTDRERETERERESNKPVFPGKEYSNGS